MVQSRSIFRSMRRNLSQIFSLSIRVRLIYLPSYDNHAMANDDIEMCEIHCSLCICEISLWYCEIDMTACLWWGARNRDMNRHSGVSELNGNGKGVRNWQGNDQGNVEWPETTTFEMKRNNSIRYAYDTTTISYI